MTWEMVAGVIRAILTAAGGGLAAKGFVEASQVEPIVGAVLFLGGVLWSVWAKRAP